MLAASFQMKCHRRSVKPQSIDFGIQFKNSFVLCFVLKREICNIENEGLGEFLQGYGTPLFVSSEYSLNYSAITIIWIPMESSIKLLSLKGIFCFTLIGENYDN